MKLQKIDRLSSIKKFLVAAFAAAAVAGPVIVSLTCSPFLLAQAPQTTPAPGPAYDVVSIKPDHGEDGRVRIQNTPDSMTASGMTVKLLMQFAYNVREFQITGGPGWIDSARFDIDAKMDEATIEAIKKLPFEERPVQRRLMLQALLADRFKLKLSRSTKELPIYALVVAKNGPKLTPAAVTPGDAAPGGPGPRGGRIMIGAGEATVTGQSIGGMLEWLSREVGRKVVDKTGLTGTYDFTLHWTPERQGPPPGGPGDGGPGAGAPPSDSQWPTIFTAVQEQLGLKLEPQKGPVEILVIESVEKPSEN